MTSATASASAVTNLSRYRSDCPLRLTLDQMNALIKREAYDVALPKSLDLTDRIADAINADLENLIRPISLASRIIETARRKQRPPVPVASELDEAAVHIDAAIQLLKEEDDEREQSRLT